jgi:integrase
MVSKDKGRRFYTVRFKDDGKFIQRRTRATSQKDALKIEAKIRSELALGNFGILEKKAAPTLQDFMRKDFLSYVDNTAAKPSTATYYHDGAKRLLASDLADLRLDEITDQQAGQFAARYSHLSASSVNCGLRTLRRALHLAYEWGKLERMPKISLAKGERQRERVLSREEAEDYLAMCSQPWRDCATVLMGTAIRPGEAYKLRWEHVYLNGNGGLIQITEGKTKAARRMLPMLPAVYETLKARHESQGKPESGWVFPSGSRSGHLEESSAKKWHSRALARLRKAHEIDSSIPMIEAFQPYVMRHSCLTWLAESGCDTFTLARIAGHSSITITQRYCHPQAEAIESAFAKVAGTQNLCTKAGYQRELPEARITDDNNLNLVKSKE